MKGVAINCISSNQKLLTVQTISLIISLVKSKRFNHTQLESSKSSVSVGVGGGSNPASPASPASLTSSSGSNDPGSVPTTPQAGTRNSELTNSLTPGAGVNTSESTTARPVTSEAKTGTPVTFEAESYVTPEPKTATQNTDIKRPTQNPEAPSNEVPPQRQEIAWTPDEGRDPEEFEQLGRLFGYLGPKSDS